MSGKLDLKELKKAVSAGEIDTVLAVQTDMQGRLMGKRFQAEFFCESAWQETHSCNYLLATDLEMSTIDGYKASSWARGYGDYTMKPDLSTLRRIPWLDGTALVFCDVIDHHTHAEVPHAPRTILKKQCRRLTDLGMKAFMASRGPVRFARFSRASSRPPPAWVVRAVLFAPRRVVWDPPGRSGRAVRCLPQ